MKVKYRFPLTLLSLAGAGVVMISTLHYGAGITQGDSVEYISAARNLAMGNGLKTYYGEPLANFPPLYSVLLAVIDCLSGVDPADSAGYANAFLFGLIVYLSGLLFFRHLHPNSAISWFGATMVAISKPLIGVSVNVLSEPLFIFFTLVFIIYTERYIIRKDYVSLIIFSISAAMACLTRYIGITLILTGALVILIVHLNRIKACLASLLPFLLISCLPIGLLITRNYFSAGNLLGSHRPPPDASQAASWIPFYLQSWYFPSGISLSGNHLVSKLLLLAVIFFLLYFTYSGGWKKLSWQEIISTVSSLFPMILFTAIFAGFLVITSPYVAYDRDSRLLTPIFIPLNLLLLTLAAAIIDYFKTKIASRYINAVVICGMCIWLVYPASSVISQIVIPGMKDGVYGYNFKYWSERSIIKYLQENPFKGSMVYTNAPDAVYILSDSNMKFSPGTQMTAPMDRLADIARLKGKWPEKASYLIWFDRVPRSYLFTPEEIASITGMRLVQRFDNSEGPQYSDAVYLLGE